MIYATDLDRTIIFSNKFVNDCEEPIICVEGYENRPISYMTSKALQKLEELKTKTNLKIIPVTTRSVAQFKRVQPVQDCEYAITSNGGTILHNGKPFLPWCNYVSRIAKEYETDFKYMSEYLKKYSSDCDIPLNFVDNIFFYMKLKDNAERNQELLNILDVELDKSKWSFTLQGLKLYVIPKDISKENALLYLKKYLNEDKLVVSGDGKLDIGFLSIGDICIIPDGSEVLGYLPHKSFAYKSVPKGLNGTSDLFDIIEKNL